MPDHEPHSERPAQQDPLSFDPYALPLPANPNTEGYWRYPPTQDPGVVALPPEDEPRSKLAFALEVAGKGCVAAGVLTWGLMLGLIAYSSGKQDGLIEASKVVSSNAAPVLEEIRKRQDDLESSSLAIILRMVLGSAAVSCVGWGFLEWGDSLERSGPKNKQDSTE